ncbi:hypothetical protein CC79DRAFT_503006 [Sarocladium strictum]
MLWRSSCGQANLTRPAEEHATMFFCKLNDCTRHCAGPIVAPHVGMSLKRPSIAGHRGHARSRPVEPRRRCKLHSEGPGPHTRARKLIPRGKLEKFAGYDLQLPQNLRTRYCPLRFLVLCAHYRPCMDGIQFGASRLTEMTFRQPKPNYPNYCCNAPRNMIDRQSAQCMDRRLHCQRYNGHMLIVGGLPRHESRVG